MRGVKALGSTLIALLAVAVPGVLTAPLARADEPQAYVSITLGSIEPALPKRGGTITLTGRVKNTSKQQLGNLQVIFWRSFDPILDAEGMDRALMSAADEPLGNRQAKNYQNIPSETDRTLAPGESAAFTLTANIRDLELPSTDAVFLIGVHVKGRIKDRGADLTLGRGRVFLPLVDRVPRNTLQLTTLVTLSSRPSLLSPGLFIDDHLAKEVGPGGRLRRLLSDIDQSAVSFAVDPLLIAELRTMAQGYRVRVGSDGTREGKGRDAARRWLQSFDRVRGDGFRLPYASVDVAALTHAHQRSVLEASANATASVSGLDQLPVLVIPGDGMADEATLKAAAELDPAAVVLSDKATSGAGPLVRAETSTVVAFTESAFGSGGPGPDPRETPVQIQQRTLADSWIETSTAAADATLGRVRLVRDPDETLTDDLAPTAPWVRQTTLSELLRGTPASLDQKLSYPEAAQSRELSRAQLRAIARFGSSLQTYQDLLVDSADAAAVAPGVLARTAHLAWRGAETSFPAFLDALQAEVSTTLDTKIRISTNRKVTTTGETGSFPITVVNTLPPSDQPDQQNVNAVKARIVFRSANRQRLSVDTVDIPRINAGQSLTSTAVVNARTNGTVPVTAQLQTMSGQRIGKPVRIDVQATQAGTVGWLIALAAGVVLVGTTALRIRQVAKERATAVDEAIQVAPNGPSPAPGSSGTHSGTSGA